MLQLVTHMKTFGVNYLLFRREVNSSTNNYKQQKSIAKRKDKKVKQTRIFEGIADTFDK